MWNVREAEINVAEAYCRTPNVFGCGNEIETVGLYFMNENNLRFPSSFQEAKRLYGLLLRFINGLENAYHF